QSPRDASAYLLGYVRREDREERRDVEIRQVGCDSDWAAGATPFKARGNRLTAARQLGRHFDVDAPVRRRARRQGHGARGSAGDRALPRLSRQLDPKSPGVVEIAANLKSRVGHSAQSRRAEVKHFGEALKAQLLGLSLKLVFIGLQVNDAAGREMALGQ